MFVSVMDLLLAALVLAGLFVFWGVKQFIARLIHKFADDAHDKFWEIWPYVKGRILLGRKGGAFVPMDKPMRTFFITVGAAMGTLDNSESDGLGPNKVVSGLLTLAAFTMRSHASSREEAVHIASNAKDMLMQLYDKPDEEIFPPGREPKPRSGILPEYVSKKGSENE